MRLCFQFTNTLTLRAKMRELRLTQGKNQRDDPWVRARYNVRLNDHINVVRPAVLGLLLVINSSVFARKTDRIGFPKGITNRNDPGEI